MVRNLIEHEGKLALLLDEQMLRELRIGANTPLDVVVRGRALVVTAANEPITDDELDRVLEAVNQDFGGAFKRLAE